ncbi:transcriptional regulator [Mycolicibacterium phlei]|jgi:AcrR family transcriptional regulator|uniref:TetR/AcrR family transcriptional regulator n=1 Tax=Mycolicibacterium phlei TaxID=1771 RepID=UPI00025ADD69|nr:TetR/AcrR family transcriptional regulator [Mycolicibacterium phlei]VEG08245.1 transcriptional regulator [Mycobacteroides chelonae]AMO60124.1 Bacterial regulatory protein, tetR family [Mycolicibacterium phlei]EID16827.1 transcriptional regulator [Mycolicibacterium phlei RIVM601174]KXW71105.1 TetR family transcriptional regulator [Mycolicibacterium phlei DSM 43070]KXW79362.1 TetR family transcriptional regulator [Mycolicibacterium phlei DSM 43071]
MSGASTDPRPARSRARLLDAAASLLRTGGPNAVTVDAVTRTANVARATLYRHFSSANDLMAAAFTSLLSPAPMPPAEGSLRDRLVAVVHGWAETIAEASTVLTAMTWMASGPDVGSYPDARQGDSEEFNTLRARIVQLYSAPFDAILDSPQAAEELDEVDRIQTIALLIGPLILGKLSTVADFDYRACAEAAVDGFLATHARRKGGITAPSSESAGA